VPERSEGGVRAVRRAARPPGCAAFSRLWASAEGSTDLRSQRAAYACGECGHRTTQWYGQCPACFAWNSLKERQEAPRPPGGAVPPMMSLAQVDRSGDARLAVGLAEFDRVLGGGLVPGATVLIAGDPGIGKSTLLLQAAQSLSTTTGKPVLYLSAEESASQVRLRADRLGIQGDSVLLVADTDVDRLSEAVAAARPVCVMVDSIQSVRSGLVEGAPGSLAQVRCCAEVLTGLAREAGVPVLAAGHVTKEGAAAGPRTLEHLVDAVLYFEGDRHQQLRVLRAEKNRYGSVDELGLFEMTDAGLSQVADPTDVLLRRRRGVMPSGCAIAAALSGSRPLAVEVEALVVPASYGTGRRVAVGLDGARTSLILAVLERRAGVPLGQSDVFVGVSGGLRLSEPGVDLALAVAVASSARDAPLDAETVFIGELSLSGELRSVSGMRRRIQEAGRLGFASVVCPPGQYSGTGGARVRTVGSLEDALSAVLG